MAFIATMTLVDDYGRITTKKVETTDALLAGAKTSIGSLATILNTLTDLALLRVTYSEVDDAAAFAGVADSNVDVGATFKVVLDDGALAAYKIPGFPSAKVGGNGGIDPADTDVAAYFALFATGGTLRMSDGEAVDSVVSGQLDR